MKNLLNKASQRPLITITIAYIIFLIALDYSGFFSPAKRSEALHFASLKTVTGSGLVVSEPETKNGPCFFILKASEIGGKKIAENISVNYPSDNSPVAIGDVVQLQGNITLPPAAKNPGTFNYASFLNRQSIYTVFWASSLKIIGHKNENIVSSFSRALRKDIITTFRRYLPQEESAVLIPRVLGDKRFLTEETKEEFTDSGVMHILVVSGINVAYVSALFLLLFRLIGLRKRKAALLTIPFIVIYAIVTGANPPIIRASIMAVFVVFSLSLEREPLVFQSLALSGLIILIFEPQALFTASFQFSFCATAGIVYLYRYFMLPFSRLPFWLRQSVGAVCAVSLSAQIAIMPLFAYYFNRISVIGLLTNIFVVPLGGIVTATGILLYLAHFLGHFAASLVAAFNYYAVHLIITIVVYSSKIKNAVIHVPSPSILFISAYYLLLTTLFKVRKHPKPAFLAALALLVLFAKPALSLLPEKHRLEINCLAIPSSGTAHIRFPNGKYYLVGLPPCEPDGYDAYEKVLFPYLWSKGTTRIDRVFISNTGACPAAGFKKLAKNFNIAQIIVSPSSRISDGLIETASFVKENGIPVEESAFGKTFNEGGSTVTIISPSVASDRNDDNSLVIMVCFENVKVLLTNEMGSKEEKELCQSKIDFKTSVLQLPKNGLRPVSPEFLKRADPEILVGYYAPTENSNRRVYSLKKSGAITVYIENGKIRIEEFKKEM